MDGGNFREKFTAFGEKVKVGSGELSRKVSERISTVSDKMKDLFQVSTLADKLVEDATGESMEGPDWEKNLEICDLVNMEKVSGQDAARAIKKRIMLKSIRSQCLALTLLEMCVKNCEKMFSEVASEKVLDEMVKMVDDRTSSTENREKVLKLIEAWGESTEELRYLPIFEETCKSLKSRGIRFPGRDEESLAPIFTPPQSVSRSSAGSGPGFEVHFRDVTGFLSEDSSIGNSKEVLDVARNSAELLNTVLTSSPRQEALEEELTLALVEQCRASQFKVQRIVESTGDADPVLFEALIVNDDLQRVLTMFVELSKGESKNPQQAESTFVHVQGLDELDTQGTAEEACPVQKRDIQPSAPPTSAQDDTAMTDLDEMIFGNRAGEETYNMSKKQTPDDLIMF